MWETVLNEIKMGKNSFDYQFIQVSFGPIQINFRMAQKKINNKYDQLHKEIMNEFGKNL